ncbi:MAG: flagellar brake domain-containing protein [Bacillota bacterium]|nr:flagellar brake domain-containing protein [Bacillota bacterium]
MKVKDLKVNQRIEITVDEEDTVYKSMSCRVEEITGQYIYISVPTLRGEILPLRVGLRVTVNFVQEGHSFVFNSRIVDRNMKPMPLLGLAKPYKIIEIQRRLWVRVGVNIPVEYDLKGSTDKESYGGKGSSIDISGGGILIITTKPVDPGQILNLQIQLPNREPVYCAAKVLRVFQEDVNKKKYKVVLEYHEISEGQRDQIMKFIFEKQREWIRKGLL